MKLVNKTQKLLKSLGISIYFDIDEVGAYLECVSNSNFGENQYTYVFWSELEYERIFQKFLIGAEIIDFKVIQYYNFFKKLPCFSNPIKKLSPNLNFYFFENFLIHHWETTLWVLNVNYVSN